MLTSDESIRLPPIRSWHGGERGSEKVANVAKTIGWLSAPSIAVNANPVDFSDPESQRVLTAAALAVARELGREGAREYFAELFQSPRVAE